MYVVYSKETTDSVVHVTRKKRHLQRIHVASGSDGLYLFPLSDMSAATSLTVWSLIFLGVCSFLAARFCYCYSTFYYSRAKPLLIVLLSKIMGGDCDAMILAAAQAILWSTRGFLFIYLC